MNIPLLHAISAASRIIVDQNVFAVQLSDRFLETRPPPPGTPPSRRFLQAPENYGPSRNDVVMCASNRFNRGNTLKERSLLNTILSTFTPVHRDGHKFIAIAGLATIALFVVGASSLGWIAGLVTVFVGYFFRDPDRATPIRDGLVIAPADGKIIAIGLKRPPRELGFSDEPMTCISIFLSVFDVHIIRSAVTGTIIRKTYVPGLFINAASDKASEDNERLAMALRTPNGDEVGMIQIAGLVARRIVDFVREGETAPAGSRVGLIRFGSRVDVYVRAGKGLMVAEGQRTIAGETVLADFKSDETIREVRVS
jgi:phosphatidylserine decarboxylase